MNAKERKSIVCVTKPVQDRIAPMAVIIITVPISIYLAIMSRIIAFVVMFLPLWLIAAFSAIYIHCWKIIFSKSQIQCFTLFSQHCYTFSQVNAATEFLSYSGNCKRIWLTFADGKRLSISQRDRNFVQCRRVILSHCPIKSVL